MRRHWLAWHKGKGFLRVLKVLPLGLLTVITSTQSILVLRAANGRLQNVKSLMLHLNR